MQSVITTVINIIRWLFDFEQYPHFQCDSDAMVHLFASVIFLFCFVFSLYFKEISCFSQSQMFHILRYCLLGWDRFQLIWLNCECNKWVQVHSSWLWLTNMDTKCCVQEEKALNISILAVQKAIYCVNCANVANIAMHTFHFHKVGVCTSFLTLRPATAQLFSCCSWM